MTNARPCVIINATRETHGAALTRSGKNNESCFVISELIKEELDGNYEGK